jgi:hypothetical protein
VIGSSNAIRTGEAAAFTFEAVIINSNAIRTGEVATSNGFEKPAGFKSSDRHDNFDFNNGYFTAFNTEDLKVKVVGFDDGERVARKVLLLDTDREFVRFGPLFDDIDEVRFTTKGGTDPDPNTFPPLQRSFGVDDLFIDFGRVRRGSCTPDKR